jgi:hypothetical protein
VNTAHRRRRAACPIGPAGAGVPLFTVRNCGMSAAPLKFQQLFYQFNLSLNGLAAICASHKIAGLSVTKPLFKLLSIQL